MGFKDTLKEIEKNLAADIKDTDIVYYENRAVKPTASFVYYKLHKPKGYVTTVSDEKERKTVMDLLRGVHTRVYPVGRLDMDSEGLLFLTNDGEFANRLMHPKHAVLPFLSSSRPISASFSIVINLSSSHLPLIRNTFLHLSSLVR